MGRCHLCGAETVLFDNDVPVCVKCYDERKPRNTPSQDSLTLSDRAKRIALWRSRAAEAKQDCDLAQRRTKAVQTELGHGAPASDGQYALQQALRNETRAHAKYVRLLKLCADVLGGKPASGEDA